MGMPQYEGKLYVAALKDHINLGFCLKGLSRKEKGLLEGRGRTMRHVKIHSLNHRRVQRARRHRAPPHGPQPHIGGRAGEREIHSPQRRPRLVAQEGVERDGQSARLGRIIRDARVRQEIPGVATAPSSEIHGAGWGEGAQMHRTPGQENRILPAPHWGDTPGREGGRGVPLRAGDGARSEE